MSDARGPAPASDPKVLFKQGLELLDSKDTEEQKKGFALMKQAADQNYPEAFRQLGRCYYYGIGILKNLNESARYYHIAADTHSIPAAYYDLGYLYCYDLPDEKKAESYLLKAITGKIDLAHNTLGLLYDRQKRYEDAVRHYQLDPVSKWASVNLAEAYAKGKGIAKDITAAYEHYREAERRGWTEADAEKYYKSEDPEKKFCYKIYKKRSRGTAPLGLLTRKEDYPEFTKLADKYYSASEYGRAILFSALAAIFAPDDSQQEKYLGYINKIIENPPLWDRNRIVNFASVFRDVAKEYISESEKRPEIEDAFVYLWVVSEKVMRNKKYSEGYWAVEEVPKKFKESYMSIMQKDHGMNEEEARKRFDKLKSDSKTIIDEEQKSLAQKQSSEQKSPPEEKKSTPGVVSAPPLKPSLVVDPTPKSLSPEPVRDKTGDEFYQEAINYLQGKGVQQDEKKAFDLFLQAEKENHPMALYYLAEFYEYGRAWVSKDEKKAREYYEKVSAAIEKTPLEFDKSGQALHNLGWVYYRGLGGEKDYKKACAHCIKAAEKGDKYGLQNLGILYATGRGVEKNIVTALDYFRQAELKGYSNERAKQYFEHPKRDPEEKTAYAIYQLRNKPEELIGAGWNYATGANNVTQDYKIAIDLYRAAAESKPPDPSAFVNLAHMYEEGKGVSQDMAQALKYLHIAADEHHVPKACLVLASKYLLGPPGVEKNEVKAFQYFQKTAESKDEEIHYANLRLGQMSYGGKGTPQDYKEAARYFEKAQSISLALINLGILYATGRGVEKNIPKSMDYFRQAESKFDQKYDEKSAKEFFESPLRDSEEKRAYSIYQRRNTPLGLLLRDEDALEFKRLADHHKGQHGRRLIFSALSVAFSYQPTQQGFCRGYINEIKQDPPFKDRQIIKDFTHFMEQITSDAEKPHYLKTLKETYAVDEPFVLFNLALEELYKNKNNKNLTGEFISNVSNKLKECFINISVEQLKIAPDEAEKRYDKILITRDKLLHPENKLTKPPEIKVAISPLSLPEVKVQQHQPTGAVPILPSVSETLDVSKDISPSAPSFSELQDNPTLPFVSETPLAPSMSISLDISIEQSIGPKLKEEYQFALDNDPKAMSLKEFDEYSGWVDRHLSNNINEIKDLDEKEIFLQKLTDILAKMQHVRFIKQLKLHQAKLQELIKERKEAEQVIPPEKLSDLISGPILSSDLVTAKPPELVVLPKKLPVTQMEESVLSSAPKPDSSIQLFEKKLTDFEKKLLEVKSNPNEADIYSLTAQHVELATQMQLFDEPTLRSKNIFKKLEEIQTSLTQLIDKKLGKQYDPRLLTTKKSQTSSDVSVSHGKGGLVMLRRDRKS